MKSRTTSASYEYRLAVPRTTGLKSCAKTSGLDRCHDAREEISVAVPAPDDHQVLFGVDEDRVRSITSRFVARGRNPFSTALGVEPPEVAIGAIVRRTALGRRLFVPRRRHQLLAGPVSNPLHQQSE